MLIRERTEELEKKLLSPKAAFSADAKRGREETEDPMRTKFQRDRDRILHSNSFRRLKHKTQVYIAPEGDHYRTRMTHTLEVAQIGRTMARALRLNEDLVEAIAMGHDAKKTEVAGLHGDALKIRLAAPPVDGKANAALLSFVAERLGIAKSSVSLKSGQTSRRKVLEVDAAAADIAQRLLPES